MVLLDTQEGLCNQHNGKDVDRWQTAILYLQGMSGRKRM